MHAQRHHVLLAAHIGKVDRANGGLRTAARGGEGGKIMRADQLRGGGLHGAFVQPHGHMRRQAAQQPDLPLRVLGPTPGNIEKINENYRYKLTVKCRNDRRFRDLIREVLGLYEAEKLPGKATVTVDLHSDGDI